MDKKLAWSISIVAFGIVLSSATYSAPGVKQEYQMSTGVLLGNTQADSPLNNTFLTVFPELSIMNNFDLTGSMITESKSDKRSSVKNTCEYVNAWSVVGKSQFFRNQLTLKGEYAKSRYDSETTNRRNNNTAFLAQASFIPNLDRFFKAPPFDWEMGFEYQNVEPSFHSVFNPSLENGVTHLKIFNQLSGSTWDFEVSYDRKRTNIKDVLFYSDVRTENFRAELQYSPFGNNDNHWHQPDLFTSLESIREQTFVSDGTTIKNRIRNMSAGARFSSERLDLSLEHTLARDQGYTPNSGNSRQHITNVEVSYWLGENQRIDTWVEWNQSKMFAKDNPIESIQTGLDVQFAFAQNAITGDFGIDFLFEQDQKDTYQRLEKAAYLQLNWLINKPPRQQPKLTVFFHGNYSNVHEKNSSTETSTDYRMFLGFDLNWE